MRAEEEPFTNIPNKVLLWKTQSVFKEVKIIFLAKQNTKSLSFNQQYSPKKFKNFAVNFPKSYGQLF